MDVIRTHNLISNDPQLVPRNLVSQEQAIRHFEDMLRLLGDHNMQACQRRWKALPNNMNTKKYHSLDRLQVPLSKSPLYKRIIQKLEVQWIGLRFNPNLFLGIQVRQSQEEESRKLYGIE